MKHKRQDKYNHTLNTVPKIQPKELYIADSNSRLRQINRGEVTKGGISFDSLIQLEINKSEQLSDKQNIIQTTRDSLTAILKEFGYNTPNVELKTLIDDLYKLTIIKPNQEYEILKFDNDGYIIGSEKVNENDLVVNSYLSKPIDFDKGYYKYDNGKLVKDEQKYNEIWSVL